MIDEIYSDLILELNKNPFNYKKIYGKNVLNFKDKNPLCGDEIEFFLKIDNKGTVIDVGWQGSGCAISQAAASIVSDKIKGLNAKEITKIETKDVLKELGVPQLEKNPVRIKCVVLSLKIAKILGYKYLEAK